MELYPGAVKCVGCGYCCITTPCPLAQRLYNGIRECPSLKWSKEESRYRCGIIDNARGALQMEYMNELSIGAGCCSNLNSWRKDVKKRRDDVIMFDIRLDPMFAIWVRTMASEHMNGDVMSLMIGRYKSYLEDAGYENTYIQEILKEFAYHYNNNRNNSPMAQFFCSSDIKLPKQKIKEKV